MGKWGSEWVRRGGLPQAHMVQSLEVVCLLVTSVVVSTSSQVSTEMGDHSGEYQIFMPP